MTKQQLLNRVDEMMWLPPNWDGFGTGAISHKAHAITSNVIKWCDSEFNLSVYVAVDPAGGVEGTLYFRDKRWELMIHPESGIIEFDEWCGDTFLFSGAFVPDKRQFFAAMDGENGL
jgi:hypothetical protein